MEQSSAAEQREQRAVLVAKLKRAASLPRMKDGRRPPMHVDGVSEGENGKQGEHNDVETPPSADDQERERDSPELQGDEASAMVTPTAAATQHEQTPIVPLAEPERPTTAEAPKDHELLPQATAEPPADLEADPEPDADEPAKAKKRRRRSRSRSRGSKDWKKAAPSGISPVPSPAINGGGNDSSPEQLPSQLPQLNLQIPALISPIPSHFAQFQRRAASPTSPMLYPGTSPPTPLPSLDQLNGLFRSNSAAARLMAMNKLTANQGGEAYSPSPTPDPLRSLTRNNTVTFGERHAARNLMMGRLGKRLNADTSGGEDVSAAALIPPTRSPTPKRRRPRKPSISTSTVVDDRELSSTAPNTPVAPPSPMLASADERVDPLPPPSPYATMNTRQVSIEPDRQDTPVAATNNVNEYVPRPRNRRSVVVEEDDGPDAEAPSIVEPAFRGLPPPPPIPTHVAGPRAIHSSDAPSSISTDSAGAVALPVFLAENTVYRVDAFPTSPFNTPLKERPAKDDEEEEVLYQNEINRLVTHREAVDRSPSWVEEPMLRSRMPIHDEDEEEDGRDSPLDDVKTEEPQEEDHEDRDDPFADDEVQTYPEESSSAQHIAISKAHPGEAQTFLEITDSYEPSSPSADPMSPASSEDSFSLPMQPAAVVPPQSPSPAVKAVPMSRSGSGYTGGEETRPVVFDSSGKSHSTWDKVRSAIMRTASNGGLRSRANSVTRERRTSSSVSRESGASQGDKTEVWNTAMPMHTPLTPPMLSPSASASYLNLAHNNVPRGGVSPIPPASSADLMKYDNEKLFPFPGIKQLEEERNRAKGLTSSSSPDVASPGTMSPAPSGTGSGSTLASTPLDGPRDRKLSHQASDSRLLAKYANLNSPPPMAATPSSSSQREYFDLSISHGKSPSQQISSSSKLPKDRKGVKEWLKVFSPGSGAATLQMQQSMSAGSGTDVAKPKKKPSLSDLLTRRKEGELNADWEEVSGDNTPTSGSGSTLKKAIAVQQDVSIAISRDPYPHANGIQRHVVYSDESAYTAPRLGVRPQESMESSDLAPWPSPPEHPSSTTPDPLSSLDDYNRSTSESGSTVSSQYSTTPAHEYSSSQGRLILERLDEMLGRGSRSPMWASAVDGPPRKLILSSPVLQVVNSNTVKDRFLFLFTDIIVIAKPIMHDHDSLLDPTPLDRKFTVKNVVQLRDLRFTADRDVAGSVNHARHPAMSTFIQQFAEDPDRAISGLSARLGTRPDPYDIAQILSRAPAIDRARLGEYFCRRSSRPVLKAYADAFGLSGLRIDKALRCFLQSIVVPAKFPNCSPLEYLSDAFAGRWYEANASRVAFDKDMAIRLCRAIIQLNQVLYGGVAGHRPFSEHGRREVSGSAFISAFKQHDRSGLVPEDTLGDIYRSIHLERLSQVHDPLDGKPSILVNVKRAVPTHLTYNSWSDPVVIRLPQPDPNFYIELFGEDLVFEPAVLTFARSAEGSFRVKGKAFGSRVMYMVRSGLHAPLYTGLPLSSTVTVERAFMRHTFQLAFLNHQGLKRKYMFSLDDPLKRHQWTVSLKRQIEAVADAPLGDNPAPAPSRFHRAADAVAFKVLQDTLIGPSDLSVAALAIDKALSREAASRRFAPDSRFARANVGLGVLSPDRRASHVRSKSRSKIYHRHGAGKMEMESNAMKGHRPDASVDFDDDPLSRQAEGPIWTGQDLQLLCQQNSSIPLVLSFLQVGSPDHNSFQWSISGAES